MRTGFVVLAALTLAVSGCKKKEPTQKAGAREAPVAAAPGAPAPVAAAPGAAAPVAAAPGAAAPVAAAPGVPAPVSLPAGRYAVDPVHSAVIARARHLNAGNVYVWFREFEGSFTVDPDPAKSSVEVTVKTASVDSRVEKRDNHLRSPDFFNAAQFPTATFKSTRIERAGDGTWNLSGDLTVRGVTRPVTAKLVPLGSGRGPTGKTLVGLEARLTVNRHDFGVSFMKGGIGDDIEMTIALEGVMQ
jgi:polyisoprenoid-binding protein YceI